MTHSMFLKVITTVSAHLKLLEPTPLTKWAKWTKFGPNLDKRANFESRDPKTLGHSMFLKVITTVISYMKLLEPTKVAKWVKWTKFGPQLAKSEFKKIR